MAAQSLGKRSRDIQSISSDTLGSVACRRCRSKKVKCGGEFPSCIGCIKADVPCIIADPTAPRDYTRAEVYELLEKLHGLENANASRPRPRPPEKADEKGVRRFVGQENGMGFFLARMSSLRGRSGRPRRSRPQIQAPIVYHAPHPFPADEVATLAVQAYFQDHHIAHPHLDPETVWATLHRRPALTPSQTPAEKHDIFQLFLVMAIGSVPLYRSGQFPLHPFGFFTAALEFHPPSASSFNTLQDIENLLLIARFGVFHDIGCSLWELGRLCIRIAVELRLHQDLPSHTERSRSIFWEAYLLDRFSSSTLGRPSAIDDESITAPLPPSGSVFHWLVVGGQLTSRIHSAMRKRCRPDAPYASGDTLSVLPGFHAELRAWRSSAPAFANPSCLAESVDFFHLTYQETRLRLLRTSIDRLSERSPPENLLRACLQAACSVIFSFNTLRMNRLVTFTRSYTHVIFIASLVVVFMMNRTPRIENGSQVSDIDVDYWLQGLDDGSFDIDNESVWEILGTASETLAWFAEAMPDMLVYARFIEDIRQELGHNRQTSPTSRVPLDWRALASGIDSPRGITGIEGVVCQTPGLPQPDALFKEPLGVAMGMTNFPVMEMGECSYDLENFSSFPWSFSDVLGMQGLDTNLSGYIWDTGIPWHGSPSAFSMDT